MQQETRLMISTSKKCENMNNCFCKLRDSIYDPFVENEKDEDPVWGKTIETCLLVIMGYIDYYKELNNVKTHVKGTVNEQQPKEAHMPNIPISAVIPVPKKDGGYELKHIETKPLTNNKNESDVDKFVRSFASDWKIEESKHPVHDLEFKKQLYTATPCHECGKIMQGLQDINAVRGTDNNVVFVCKNCFDKNHKFSHIKLVVTAERPQPNPDNDGDNIE